MHTHPSVPNSEEKLESLLETLTNQSSITGLTVIKWDIPYGIFSFEDTIKLPESNKRVRVDRQLEYFAKITWMPKKEEPRTGYVIRTQEIAVAGGHHILAAGIKGNYIPNNERAEETIGKIRKQEGVAIINHPYLMPKASYPFSYRDANTNEIARVEEICKAADEIESFNGEAINAVPSFAWFTKLNAMAKKLAKECNYKGTSASDAHTYSEIGQCGIVIPSSAIDGEKIKTLVSGHDFTTVESYSSRAQVFSGRFLLR